MNGEPGRQGFLSGFRKGIQKYGRLTLTRVEVRSLFFWWDTNGQIKEMRRTNSKLSKRLVQFLITKPHPLIPHLFLHSPTTFRAIFNLAQVDVISQDNLLWHFSRVTKGIGKQNPEAFMSRGGRSWNSFARNGDDVFGTGQVVCAAEKQACLPSQHIQMRRRANG